VGGRLTLQLTNEQVRKEGEDREHDQVQ